MRMNLRGGLGFVATFVLLLIVCGCVHTVTKDGLEEIGMERAAKSYPDQTFYVGSQMDYDYFVVRSGNGKHSSSYRVRKSEEAVRERFGRTADEMKWREYGNQMVVTNGVGIGR